MPDIIDDKETLDALKQQSPGAFDKVYEETVVALCYFIRKLTNDQQASEDIAAESFIKTFDRVKDFPTMASLKSFLYTVAHNAGLDFIKAQKRHRNSHNEIQYLSEEKEESAEKKVIRAEVLQAIYFEIEKLPHQSREVVKLSLLENKTVSQVAEELGMAYKTVQHYKTQGLKILRIKLLQNRLLSLSIITAAVSFIEAYQNSGQKII